MGPSYLDWINRFDILSPKDLRQIASQISTWKHAPFFHVLLTGEDEEALQRSIASLDTQLFRGYVWAKADGMQSLQHFNATLAQAPTNHWALLLRAGDALAPHALYWLAWAAQTSPQASVIYADEDILDEHGRRCQPQFKPHWSLAYARSTRFIGEAVALQARTCAIAGGVTADDCHHGIYDAVLRVMDVTVDDPNCAPVHIPAVLLHRNQGSAYADGDAWAMDAVRSHLARRGVVAKVELQQPGCWRVRYALPTDPPLVSIIVPTRDAPGLTRRCIESLRVLTRYPHYEIVLVDNQSKDPEALAWMQAQATHGMLRLLHYNQPFNYSAINNMAVRAARGEFICLLNNDTEVIQADWLEEMVTQLLQPGVDVVGAKLLYPNDRVQHAGDLVGVGGVANHAFACLGRDEPGYGSRAVVAQEYSAVTAACLLTRRQRYLDLGGLDERHLPVAFNDVDYCLRVREAGYKVVWTPYAVLYHHESVSRGKDKTLLGWLRAKREVRYMRLRWRDVLQNDPYYNPNFSKASPNFVLGMSRRVIRPWDEA